MCESKMTAGSQSIQFVMGCALFGFGFAFPSAQCVAWFGLLLLLAIALRQEDALPRVGSVALGYFLLYLIGLDFLAF